MSSEWTDVHGVACRARMRALMKWVRNTTPVKRLPRKDGRRPRRQTGSRFGEDHARNRNPRAILDKRKRPWSPAV
jgi:hypothetical protein